MNETTIDYEGVSADGMLYLGEHWDGKNQLNTNLWLKERGSAWRVTTARTLGWCIWNPTTQEHRGKCPAGFVVIPDLVKKDHDT